MSGQASYRSDISNVTNGKPCTVTTTEEHGYATHDQVRITDLNGMIPIPRGQNPINNYRYKIVVTSTTEFYLKDPITNEVIDSTNYPPYVEGGYCNKIAQEFNYES